MIDMRRAHRIGLAAIVGAFAFVGVLTGTVNSQNLQIHPIDGVDLSVRPLALRSDWAGGVLRVVVRGLPNDGSEKLVVEYGDASSLELDADALASRTVRQVGGAITLDLPVVAGATVRASSPMPGVRVAAFEVLVPSLLRPEQRLDGSTVSSLTKQSPKPAIDYARAFARLDMQSASGAPLGVCTATRMVQGYWLTAAHCGYRTPDKASEPPIIRFSLQPENWAGELEPARLLTATIVASGLHPGGGPTLLQDDDLDYLILHAPDDPGGPTIPLSSAIPAEVGTKLVLLQHSAGALPPPAGKAISDGDSCQVRPRVGAENTLVPSQCIRSIQHGCSSQKGASGGALVDRASYKLVAVHYRSGRPEQFNCGLPAKTVALDLCQHNPTIAGKVTSCTPN